MAAPVLVSHNLTNGAYRNLAIILTFDGPLDASTVGPTSIILSVANRMTDLQSATYAYNADDYTVTITPDYVLDALTTYKLTLLTSLKASDSTPLAEAADYTFSTGETLAEPPQTRPDGDHWREATTQGASEGFTLLSSTPKNADYDINTNPDQRAILEALTFVFSQDVKADLWPAAPTSWSALPLTVETMSVDGRKTTPASVPDIDSVEVSGATVTINLTPRDATVYNTDQDADADESTTAQATFLPNNIVTITLSEDILSASGGSLAETVVEFTTELFPKFTSSEAVYRRYKGLTDAMELTPAELDFFVYEESAWLARYLDVRYPDTRLDLPSNAMQDFVIGRARYRLLEEAVAVNAAAGGSHQDKQLGPFRVSRSYMNMPKIYTKLLEEMEGLWKSALDIILPINHFAVTIKGIDSPYRRRTRPDAAMGRRLTGEGRSPWMARW